MIKRSIKIIIIFFLSFLLITQVNAAISMKDIRNKYNNDKNVINTLTEKEVKEWQKEIESWCKLMGSVTGDPSTITSNAITSKDKKEVQSISDALLQRKQDIQSEKDEKENEKKTTEEKKKEDEELKKYDIKEIYEYLTDHGAKNISEDVKKQWEKTIEESNESEEYKQQVKDALDGKTIEEQRKNADASSTSIYKQPELNKSKTAAGSLSDLIADGKSFLYNGDELQYDESSLQNFSTAMYNILLAIAVAIALIVGVIVGIKYMVGSVEEKANYKAMLIPYVAGCAVVFGAFGIWKLVVTILESI